MLRNTIGIQNCPVRFLGINDRVIDSCSNNHRTNILFPPFASLDQTFPLQKTLSCSGTTHSLKPSECNRCNFLYRIARPKKMPEQNPHYDTSLTDEYVAAVNRVADVVHDFRIYKKDEQFGKERPEVVLIENILKT